MRIYTVITTGLRGMAGERLAFSSSMIPCELELHLTVIARDME